MKHRWCQSQHTRCPRRCREPKFAQRYLRDRLAISALPAGIRTKDGDLLSGKAVATPCKTLSPDSPAHVGRL